MSRTSAPAFMPKRAKILLISKEPELQLGKLLETRGYLVHIATSFDSARQAWRPRLYDLVLIAVNGDSDAALKFCEKAKLEWPRQVVALSAGWNSYVPKHHCPDEVIRREHNPAQFLKQVAELVPPTLA